MNSAIGKKNGLTEPGSRQARASALREALEAMVRTLGPGTKLPTVLDLCRQLEVTPPTLDRALKDLEQRNLVQRRHGVGIFVSQHLERRSIALLLNSKFVQGHAGPDSWFWDNLVELAQKRASLGAEAFSFHLVLPDAGGQEPLQVDLARSLRAGSVDGVIGVGVGGAVTVWLEELGIPYVGFSGGGQYDVRGDRRQWYQLAMGDLAQRGCRRVGLWLPNILEGGTGDPAACPPHFSAALTAAGLEIHPELVWSAQRLLGKKNLTVGEQGYELALALGKFASPDGVFVVDETLMRGALFAFGKSGHVSSLPLPFVSHCNRGSQILSAPRDNLALVEMDPTEIADALFDMLEELMAGQTPSPPHNRLIQARFIPAQGQDQGE